MTYDCVRMTTAGTSKRRRVGQGPIITSAAKKIFGNFARHEYGMHHRSGGEALRVEDTFGSARRHAPSAFFEGGGHRRMWPSAVALGDDERAAGIGDRRKAAGRTAPSTTNEFKHGVR